MRMFEHVNERGGRVVLRHIEEEASAEEIVRKLKLIGGSGDGLSLLDGELGQRTFTPTPARGK